MRVFFSVSNLNIVFKFVIHYRRTVFRFILLLQIVHLVRGVSRVLTLRKDTLKCRMDTVPEQMELIVQQESRALN